MCMPDDDELNGGQGMMIPILRMCSLSSTGVTWKEDGSFSSSLCKMFNARERPIRVPRTQCPRPSGWLDANNRSMRSRWQTSSDEKRVADTLGRTKWIITCSAIWSRLDVASTKQARLRYKSQRASVLPSTFPTHNATSLLPLHIFACVSSGLSLVLIQHNV